MTDKELIDELKILETFYILYNRPILPFNILKNELSDEIDHYIIRKIFAERKKKDKA